MKNNNLLHFGLFMGRLSLPMVISSFARWLRVIMITFLFTGMSFGLWAAINVVRVENPTGEGSDFTSWNDAMAYLKEQSPLTKGESYTMVINSSGLQMGTEMPDKPCIITTSAISSSTKYELTIPDKIDLKAPLTFDKVKLDGIDDGYGYKYTNIYANGHELVFTEQVEMISGFDVYLYGGAKNTKTPVENTSIVLNGGTFAGVEGGSASNKASVTGTTTVKIGGTIKCPYDYLTISGGGTGSVHNDAGTAVARVLIGENAKFDCGVDIYGGNMNNESKCDSSAVVISGNASLENGCYVYAGGENGHVGGTLLRVTGNPKIGSSSSMYSLYGGGLGKNSTVGNTTVEIEGGTFVNPNNRVSDIYGGGYACNVTGDTHVCISGGTGLYRVYGGNAGHDGFGDFDGETAPIGGVKGTAHILISGGDIAEVYGGGAGSGTVGVGNVDLRVTGTAVNSKMAVYGCSVLSQVSGDVNISIEGGKMESVYLAEINSGTVTNPKPNWRVEGNTNILIKGGTIGEVGGISVSGGTNNKFTVDGEVNIVVEGNEAKVDKFNAYNLNSSLSDDWRIPFKPATLTFKNCGTTAHPYYPASDIALFTKVVADNSYINMGDKSFILKKEHPLVMKGKTWQKPQHGFSLKSWDKDFAADNLKVNDVLVQLEETDDWSSKDFSFGSNSLYKVGNTIRYDNAQTFHTVTINNVAEPEKGSLEVVWDGTVVNSGDKLPEVESMKLTATVKPALGYSGKLFKGDDVQLGLSLETKCDADMTFSAAFTEKSYTVTYEQPEHGTVTVQDAGGATIESGGTVAYKTQNTLVVTPAAGYQIGANAPSATYIEDGQTEAQPLQLTPVEGKAGHYSFEMPAGEVTITAEFSSIPPYNPPYVPSYYDLYFEENDSVRLSSNHTTVEEGYSFTITAEVAEGYDSATLVVEYKKGRSGNWRILEPESNGTYRVRNVYNDIYVRACVRPGGDPTALDRVKDGTSLIRALDKRIHITVNEPVKMRIVGIGGRVVRTEQLPAGYSEISGLQDGIYIVILSDGTRSKVVIR